MPQTTLVFAALLVGLGLAGYFGTGGESVTALIPAFFGAALAVAGLLARRESWRMHAMHVAVLVGLLGFLGSARGLLQLPALLGGGAERPVAVAAQSVMAVLMAVFVVLCVRSFIAARRARQAQPPPA